MIHQTAKTGILLGQVGTPGSPTKAALRPYLKQFLSDHRVIEMNRWLWWPILHGIILPFRSPKSALLYQKIWKGGESPLLTITRRQTELVRDLLRQKDSDTHVCFGFRYGEPSLEKGLDFLIKQGCSRILLFNLYPQYSSSTSASNFDAVFSHLLKYRVIPALKVAEPFFSDPRYIQALSANIADKIDPLSSPPERIILSYHGIPKSLEDAGDPYPVQCVATTEAIRQSLPAFADRIVHAYQSRFGKARWITPDIRNVVNELHGQGVRHIAVACPGFVADCLETLYEIEMELTKQFQKTGVATLTYIPALNTHPEWINALENIIWTELGNWVLEKNEIAEISSHPCA
jgi:ferrochelatase